MKRRVIFVDPNLWTHKETTMNDNFTRDDVIDLVPGAVAIRYAQSTQTDSDGYVLEAFRVELTTNRGPFAVCLTPAALVEFAGHLLNAFNQLDQQRETWANQRDGGRA